MATPRPAWLKHLPDLTFEAFALYFRLDVEGLENIPRAGGAIFLPNHSGFLGLDALLLSHVLRKHRGRNPYILLHPLWFAGGFLRKGARRLGFLKASYPNGLRALRARQFLMLFPEGEAGNFKPINERYRLREFRKGFVRLAAASGVPVVPVLIVGAEETHINFGQIKLLSQLLPLPLNTFPLPAKWKIKFLPPIQIRPPRRETPSAEWLRREATGFRLSMQNALRKELGRRKYIYWDKVL